jgi:hypothetical protein
MPWSCRFLEDPPLASFEYDGKTSFYVDTKDLAVGDMWYARDDDGQIVSPERRRGMHLSDFYWQHNAARPPLMVLVPGQYTTGPGKQLFSVDGKCYNAQRGYYDGWTVHGSPAAITITPSINIAGSYHGFIQNGMVTEDCEGRRYEGSSRERGPGPPSASAIPTTDQVRPRGIDAGVTYYPRPRGRG